MFFKRKEINHKKIILEAISGKVPFIIYLKIRCMNKVDELSDLKQELSKREYNLVSRLVTEAFFEQIIWYKAVFANIFEKTEYKVFKMDL